MTTLRDRIRNGRRIKADEIGLNSKSMSTDGRIFNTNGNYEVTKIGINSDLYHYLISISWLKLVVIVIAIAVLINLFFACIYFIIGAKEVVGVSAVTPFRQFVQLFFFSAQTMTTVGYGAMYPTGTLTSIIAAIEAIIGLLSFSIATGLFYGRFSRPKESIVFSKNLIITPHEEHSNLMLRLANGKNTNIVDASAKMIATMIDPATKNRKYFSLELAVDSITFLALNWTIVHPINEKSPLYQLSQEEIIASKFELILLVNGYNQTYNQNSYSKKSYSYEDIIWNAKFKLPYFQNENNRLVFDLNKLNDFEYLSS